jgi:Zn-finger nucleic acid-binding protein
MHCPMCEGEFDPISFRAVGGSSVNAKRCNQCNGIWFPQPLAGKLDQNSVAQYDIAQPRYSSQSYDLMCPLDKTLMAQSDHDVAPNGGKFWNCPDCEGSFFPRGQLSLYNGWQHARTTDDPSIAGIGRSQAATAVVSMFVLTVAILGSLRNVSIEAAQAQTLPTSGPNVVTLVLLALTYIAGTVLAVLGRRLTVIFMGWAVIAICLFGFAVIIFGP